jgi:hypothetical protein
VRGGSTPERSPPFWAATTRSCARRSILSTHVAWPSCGVGPLHPIIPRTPSSTPTGASSCALAPPETTDPWQAHQPLDPRLVAEVAYAEGIIVRPVSGETIHHTWAARKTRWKRPNTGSPVPTRHTVGEKTARAPHLPSLYPPRLGLGVCG